MSSPGEVAALPLPLGDGRRVRLDQIAKVSDSLADRTSLAYRDGKRVFSFQVKRSIGFSDIGVAQGGRHVIGEFAKAHPQVRINEVSNKVAPIEDNYEGSLHLLLEGANQPFRAFSGAERPEAALRICT